MTRFNRSAFLRMIRISSAKAEPGGASCAILSSGPKINVSGVFTSCETLVKKRSFWAVTCSIRWLAMASSSFCDSTCFFFSRSLRMVCRILRLI